MSLSRRLLVASLAFVAAMLALAGPAAAHPLGNFTSNTSATVLPAPDHVRVLYVLDLAEVPTQQARGPISQAGGEQAWAAARCGAIAEAQRLRIEGRAAPLVVQGVDLTFPPGQAGLDTLRLVCDLVADTGALAAGVRVEYRDGWRPDRIGWREVVATGDRTTLTSSDVPSVSPSDQLRSYPSSTVSDVTTATLVVDPSHGAPAEVDAPPPVADAPAPGGLEGLVQSYTDLVSRQQLTLGFVVLAFLLAVVLGTAHAVAPGHGKTLIAASMLGQGGQARRAVALGGTVAITHTIGVLALGIIVTASSALAPERVYPVLGVIGGVLFTLVGLSLLVRALRERAHRHAHEHGHDHDHHHHEGGRGGGWRSLVLPGLAGGLVPSPSALLVLLGGIALGRAWFGVLLVLAYGVGMALALVGAGYLLHRLRGRLAERLEGRRWARISAALPVATSCLIVLGGLVIVSRSLLTASGA